jgi:hypothetical protein
MCELGRGSRVGDTHERLIVFVCGHFADANPKVAVGSVASEEGRAHVLCCGRLTREAGPPAASGLGRSDCGLSGRPAIPWSKLAFASLRRTLEAWRGRWSLPLAGKPLQAPVRNAAVAGGRDAIVRRAFNLGALAMLVGGAGPSLPLPPMPPAAVASMMQPAPVPNLAIEPPPAPAVRGEVTLAPNLYRLGREYQGDGFLAHSTVWGYQDRRMPLLPGIDVHVPID